jgi:hypothetical protein
MWTDSLTLAVNKKVNFMAKKKRNQKQLDESVAEEETQKEEEPVIDTMPKPKPTMGNFLATEWARQDPDKPDPFLFAWWDTQGAIPKEKYDEAKAKVFKKK